MNRDSQVILALDVHGGDHGPDVTVAAAVEALKARPQVEIYLAGMNKVPASYQRELEESCLARLHTAPAPVILESGVGPVTAIRQGSKSSLGRAVQMVADGQANACISAGSTTALMALGIRMLGMLPGLRRPALLSRMPTASGETCLLDLGANMHVNARQLVQFAIMGAVVCGQNSGRNPSIGLLNVGHEDSKGHSVVKEAHEKLRTLPLNYKGFIEGGELFAGAVDVAVCDGFSGNLLLKSSEGLARMFFGQLRNSLDSTFRSRLGARLAWPALSSMLARFDPAQHNGAPLLGLNGVVIKSHGAAGKFAMLQAILEAADEAGRQVPGQIQEMIRIYKAEESS